MFEEFREQMKGMSRKEKMEHYMMYYGLRTLGAVLGVCVVLFFLVHFFTRKEVVSGILVVNSDIEEQQAVNADFFADVLEENGYDAKKQTILVNTNLHVSEDEDDAASKTNMSTVFTLLNTRSVDVFLADAAFFDAVGQGGYLADLEEMLPEDFLEAQQEHLIYVKVAETGEKIAAGIRVNAEAPFMKSAGWYQKGAVVGITSAVKNKRFAVNLMKKICDGNR